jgi:hypothetical protein
MTDYPGIPVRKGSRHTSAVEAIQERLTALGYGGGLRPGVFDAAMRASVELFQAQNVDRTNLPLVIDGAIGPATWTALFGAGANDVAEVTDPLLAAALEAARSQIGIRETAGQPNRGAEVDTYIRSCGLDPEEADPTKGYAWCAAFVYWCFDQAAQKTGQANPVPKMTGVMNMWRASKPHRIGDLSAEFNMKALRPGSLFVMSFGKGLGHIGFVERHVGRRLFTIEGNSNNDGSREGLGVFRLARRTVGDAKLIGYLDFGGKG